MRKIYPVYKDIADHALRSNQALWKLLVVADARCDPSWSGKRSRKYGFFVGRNPVPGLELVIYGIVITPPSELTKLISFLSSGGIVAMGSLE